MNRESFENDNFVPSGNSLRNPDHKILFGVWNDQNSLRNGNVTLTLAHKKQIRNEVTNLLKIAKNIENPFRKMSYLHRVIVAESCPWNPVWCMKRWEFAKFFAFRCSAGLFGRILRTEFRNALCSVEKYVKKIPKMEQRDLAFEFWSPKFKPVHKVLRNR